MSHQYAVVSVAKSKTCMPIEIDYHAKTTYPHNGYLTVPSYPPNISSARLQGGTPLGVLTMSEETSHHRKI